jgi:hypothetical protein
MFQLISDLLLQIPEPFIREDSVCLDQLIKLDVFTLLTPQAFNLTRRFVYS